VQPGSSVGDGIALLDGVKARERVVLTPSSALSDGALID
jgi:hypothetical protein